MRGRLRCTKAALGVFGLGLLLGFVLVVLGGHPRLERVASGLMAIGLAALPLALFADGRGLALLGWIAARLPRRGKKKKPRPKPRAAAPRRKPASPRRRTPARTPSRNRR